MKETVLLLCVVATLAFSEAQKYTEVDLSDESIPDSEGWDEHEDISDFSNEDDDEYPPEDLSYSPQTHRGNQGLTPQNNFNNDRFVPQGIPNSPPRGFESESFEGFIPQSIPTFPPQNNRGNQGLNPPNRRPNQGVPSNVNVDDIMAVFPPPNRGNPEPNVRPTQSFIAQNNRGNQEFSPQNNRGNQGFPPQNNRGNQGFGPQENFPPQNNRPNQGIGSQVNFPPQNNRGNQGIEPQKNFPPQNNRPNQGVGPQVNFQGNQGFGPQKNSPSQNQGFGPQENFPPQNNRGNRPNPGSPQTNVGSQGFRPTVISTIPNDPINMIPSKDNQDFYNQECRKNCQGRSQTATDDSPSEFDVCYNRCILKILTGM